MINKNEEQETEEQEPVVSSTAHLVDTENTEIEEVLQIDDMEEYEEPKTKKMTKFEKKLIKNKFKIKWLGDDSGYWFQKKFKFPIFGKIKCIVEPDRDYVFFEIRTKDNYFDKRIKVKNWKQLKKILKKF